ncbi:MAG: DnaB-like helicase C-terminal domain-containing protein [Bacteroidota bacterium]
MSNLTDWIKYELYPALFEHIDSAFPEHDFRRFAGGWRSQTYINGQAHSNRQDKTVVSKKAPGIMLEQGGETISLVNYVMRRDNAAFIEALGTLADKAGIQLPPGSASDPESYQKHKDRTALLETCNSYFTWCLQNAKGAKETKTYLHERGYAPADITAMELGFIPSQSKLHDYLTGKGFSKESIEEAVNLSADTRIGTTHKLSIPYRSGGILKGFKFRTIGDAVPKYLNSPGLDRLGGFFNLSGITGNKDVIIVEGELDSLHATVKGIDNVVAIGSSAVSPTQVEDAIRRGAKRFTICLDTEPGKEESTVNSVNRVIQVILDYSVNSVYIVTLPDLGGTKTDPDRLIKELGPDAFRRCINAAEVWYQHRLYTLFNKYGKIQQTPEGLQNKDIANLLDEVVETAARIPQPIDRDIFRNLFLGHEAVKSLGITAESLAATVERLVYNRDKEQQAKQFTRLISEAKTLHESGDTDKAIGLLDTRLKDVKLKDKASAFGPLLVQIKEEDIRQRQSEKPQSLKSGLRIGGEDLLLPAGAISIVAAPTSHGKTSMLINMALNVAEAYPEKEVYFFSFEEDGDSILINTLNTYQNINLSANNRRSIKEYFATGKTDFIKAESRHRFESGKSRFFRELIDTRRLNIHYTAYDADTLTEAIHWLHKNTKAGVVFIDYMQLLHKGQKGKTKYNSRQEELKQICLDLKDAAVETGLPVILGAQFNREVINQLRLHATKIGEAGDIERIANVVLGFWNNNFRPLATDGELNEISQKGAAAPDSLYAVLLKNRGGKAGLEEILDFNGNTGRISNGGAGSDTYFVN